MKVKVLIDCVGIGYDLKAEEEAEVSEKTGKKLIKFGWGEEIKPHEEKTVEGKGNSSEDVKLVEVKQAKSKTNGKQKEKSDE